MKFNKKNLVKEEILNQRHTILDGLSWVELPCHTSNYPVGKWHACKSLLVAGYFDLINWNSNPVHACI